MSSNSRSRSDPNKIGSQATEDIVGYENRRKRRKQMRNSQRTVSGVPAADAANDLDREYRRMMKDNPDIANQK